MPVPRGTKYRIKTYPSGKRVRLAVAPDGRVIETTAVKRHASKTKTGKRLSSRRRRIHR